MTEYPTEYVQVLQQQHADMMDEVISRHLIWCPQVGHPIIPPDEPAFVTVVILNDGRSFHISTPLKGGVTRVSPPISEKQQTT